MCNAISTGISTDSKLRIPDSKSVHDQLLRNGSRWLKTRDIATPTRPQGWQNISLIIAKPSRYTKSRRLLYIYQRGVTSSCPVTWSDWPVSSLSQKPKREQLVQQPGWWPWAGLEDLHPLGNWSFWWRPNLNDLEPVRSLSFEKLALVDLLFDDLVRSWAFKVNCALLDQPLIRRAFFCTFNDRYVLSGALTLKTFFELQ